mgnify:CR=1 FL=1
MEPIVATIIVIAWLIAIAGYTVWNMARHSKVSVKQIIITWFESKFKI